MAADMKRKYEAFSAPAEVNRYPVIGLLATYSILRTCGGQPLRDRIRNELIKHSPHLRRSTAGVAAFNEGAMAFSAPAEVNQK